ncbi:MAG: type VI secretion system protein TssA [Pyrinomonadaceae bacterium]
MAEESTENLLSKPAVIDFDALLKPISDDSPAGESVRYSGVYDEINEARREDDPMAIGDVGASLKTADYNKVIEISIAALENKTKDLQLAAWLTDALVRVYGFVGLRDGLKLLSDLQTNFWDALYPEIDEGDEEARANALAWVANETSFSVKYAPITSAGFGYVGFEDSVRFDIPENLDALDESERKKFQALKKQAENENRVLASDWKKALAQSKRAFYEELDVAIEECKAGLKELDDVVEANFDPRQAPSLNVLRDQLETIQSETNKLLKQRRIEEPDPADLLNEVEEENSTPGANSEKVKATSGAIQNRADALRRLAELAVFFKQTEPHSPVSYLIDRAVKWGNMPLDRWLEDVVKDQGILGQIRQTLGFNTGSATAGEQTNEGFTSPESGSTSGDGGGFQPLQ